MDVQATQMRPGMLIKFKGDVFTIHKTEHRTPGNKRGFVQARMRNMRTGAMIDHKFASEDFTEKVVLEAQQMQYLYADGDQHYFMNTESYEQTSIPAEQLEEQMNYIIADSVVTVQFYEEKPFNIELPASIELMVTETEPAIKGSTVTNVTKPAKTETGLVVQVPGFIKNDEKIKVNTADGTYISRA